MTDRVEISPRRSNGSIGWDSDSDGYAIAHSPERTEVPVSAPSDVLAALTLRIERLTREVAEAHRQTGQVEATLAKRTSRMHQLIGERDRLTSLLAARDAELLRLSRELGALTERAAPAGRSLPILFATARAMFDRMWRTRTAPGGPKSPSAPSAERSATERPLLPWIKDGLSKPVLAVVVFGLSRTEIEHVLGFVERHCAERDLAPLLLTDNDAFELFRGRRVLFEFLPPQADQERFAADLNWRLFTLRRLALIRRKWRPVRIIAFGRQAAEAVQLWLDSPFEPTPVPASVKGRSEEVELDWGAARQPAAVTP